MNNIQDLLNAIAQSSSAYDDTKFNGIQDLLYAIAQCIEYDQTTGKCYLRIKEDDEA